MSSGTKDGFPARQPSGKLRVASCSPTPSLHTGFTQSAYFLYTSAKKAHSVLNRPFAPHSRSPPADLRTRGHASVVYSAFAVYNPVSFGTCASACHVRDEEQLPSQSSRQENPPLGMALYLLRSRRLRSALTCQTVAHACRCRGPNLNARLSGRGPRTLLLAA